MKLPITSILIGERQRLSLGDLTDLDSMSDKDVGQILPIKVHRTLHGYELVDGRRRLAKATSLGWKEIEVSENTETLTETAKQKQELLADVARLDRSWQDRCLSISKIHYMMKREKAESGELWTIKNTGLATNFGYTQTWKFLEIASILSAIPRDEECWQCTSFQEAFSRCVVDRAERRAREELERRREANEKAESEPVLVSLDEYTQVEPAIVPTASAELTTPLTYTLQNRVSDYNNAYGHLTIPNTPLVVLQNDERTFFHGFWWMGMGSHNVSDFYGSYQKDYLDRIGKLFHDLRGKRSTIHLFSGSLPPSDQYSRVGIDPTGEYKADYEIDAHELSSHLPFHPKLIYADPPYSVEDSDHYQNSMVNRAKVVEECGLILQPGGFLVWMDQALPVFSNDLFTHVGAIAYIRGTGNRFRMVSIFQRKESK